MNPIKALYARFVAFFAAFGQVGQMLEMAFAAVSLIVGLAVSTVVLANIYSGVTAPTQTTALATYNSIWSLGWTGMGLLAIAIIVLAAVVIVGYVRLMGGRQAV